MFEIVIILLMLAMFISLYRFLKGPSFSDRIVAFDTIGIMGISLLVILSLYYQRAFYIDIALVFGVIGFLGSTIFGRFIEKGI
jgi:multicomponent Na+:H+ antiporter subunit F